jgi:hypothetical protein
LYFIVEIDNLKVVGESVVVEEDSVFNRVAERDVTWKSLPSFLGLIGLQFDLLLRNLGRLDNGVGN